MNDKVKIYRRAFYFKDPVFEKETDDIIQKVNKQRKLRIKERKKLNRA